MARGTRHKRRPSASVEAQRSIALPVPVEITATSLRLPAGTAYADWQRVGRVLQQIERAVQWWIGDWLNYGERRYGEKYTQAVEATGMQVQRLMNYAWVSSQVEMSRRRENLSWSHHRAVAALPPEDQERWLTDAEREGWSVAQLGRRMRHEAPLTERVFGRPLNFRAMLNEPVNEQGVVVLFGMVAHDLGYIVDAIGPDFPDCTARRQVGRGRFEEVRIEFEFKSRTYRDSHPVDPRRMTGRSLQ